MGLIFPRGAGAKVARKEATWAQKSVFILSLEKMLPRLACLHCEKHIPAPNGVYSVLSFVHVFFPSLASFFVVTWHIV